MGVIFMLLASFGQEGPRRLPEGLYVAPRRPQEGSKRAPRGPQDPSWRQEGP